MNSGFVRLGLQCPNSVHDSMRYCLRPPWRQYSPTAFSPFPANQERPLWVGLSRRPAASLRQSQCSTRRPKADIRMSIGAEVRFVTGSTRPLTEIQSGIRCTRKGVSFIFLSRKMNLTPLFPSPCPRRSYEPKNDTSSA